MGADAVTGEGGVCEPAVAEPEFLGGLGGVLGDVCGGPLGREFSAKVAMDRLDVNLRAEAQRSVAILCGVGVSDRRYRRDELVKRPWLWKAYALLAAAQIGLGIYILSVEGDKTGLWHIGLGSFWALLGFVAFRGSRPLQDKDGQPH